MARPPSGPIGNSPRDVRDDAVGVPAEPIKAPEPPRWPPKRKKITSNTFHAKVSGGTSPSRADRAPHFRKGGFVKGYASGGVIAKRDELPGEQKNDPFDKQNLKQTLKTGGVAKRADGGSFGGGVQLPGKLRSESTELAQARRGFEKNPKDTDAALKMIRTEDQTGAYLPRRSTGEGRYKKGGKT